MPDPRETVLVMRSNIPTLIYKEEMKKGEKEYVEKPVKKIKKAD